MREIKFKIKYQSENTDIPNEILMSEPFNIEDLLFSDNTQIDFTDGGYLRFNELEQESITWLHYTGLKDKNGKEIYEGDIIKIPDDWDEYGFNAGENYQVYFAFGGFRLKPKYKKNAKGSYLEDDKIEIIGNIYENPELLNEVKNDSIRNIKNDEL